MLHIMIHKFVTMCSIGVLTRILEIVLSMSTIHTDSAVVSNLRECHRVLAV